MKKYKFRAWIRDGEWEDDGKRCKFEMIDSDALSFIEFEPLEDLLEDIEDEAYYMMSTGILDSKGQEIYEGDIVLVNGEYVNPEDGSSSPIKNLKKIVEWKSERLIGGNFFAGFSGLDFGHANVVIKVIGNIYENPKLIKGELQ